MYVHRGYICPQKHPFKWYLFQSTDFNLGKSKTSGYIFMTWKSSLEVIPTSLPCVRYCSHTVLHRCWRKASADDSLNTTAKKRGWSSNCHMVSVRGMCFTEHIVLHVLCSKVSVGPILKPLQWGSIVPLRGIIWRAKVLVNQVKACTEEKLL